eukprot:scaffold9920_cov122-Isochrysis_galbana.AAC.3
MQGVEFELDGETDVIGSAGGVVECVSVSYGSCWLVRRCGRKGARGVGVGCALEIADSITLCHCVRADCQHVSTRHAARRP